MILFPTVSMTFLPRSRRPTAIPIEPIKNEIQSGFPLFFIRMMRGLMAFATSFDPRATHMNRELRIPKNLYISEIIICSWNYFLSQAPYCLLYLFMLLLSKLTPKARETLIGSDELTSDKSEIGTFSSSVTKDSVSDSYRSVFHGAKVASRRFLIQLNSLRLVFYESLINRMTL